MMFNPDSIVGQGDPDDAGLLAMKAALRDLKVSLRKSPNYPQPDKTLAILADVKMRIERING